MALGVLEIEAGAERLGAAGEHHGRGVAVVLKTARGVGELTQRLRRKRIDAVAAIETHHGNAAFRAEALFDGYKISQPGISLPVIFFKDSPQIPGRLPFVGENAMRICDVACAAPETRRRHRVILGLALRKKYSVIFPP